MTGRSGRHRAQAGTTLVELVVSVAIIGLALMLLVGAFSSGVLDATLVKRNTAADAAIQYELEQIQASAFTTTPQSYSDCFAVDSPAQPSPVAYQTGCPSRSNLRLDVTESDVQAGAIQQWTVQVKTYPSGTAIGKPVSIYKINR